MANLSSYLPGGIDPAAVTITGGTINGTTIGASTPSTGAFTTLTATAASTITTADNNPQLTLISTDADANVGPVLKLYRNSGSPADNDILGRIQFSGEDDVGNDSTFGRIDVVATDVSNDTEDARMEFSPAVGDAFTPTMSLTGGNVGIGTTSPSSSLDISQTNARIKVQDGTNQLSIGLWDGANYRVEGDANRKILITSYHSDGIHLGGSGASDLVIKGNKVGIGTTSPSSYLSEGSHLVLADSGHTGMTIASGTSSEGGIFFADGTSSDATYRGILRYNHGSDYMQFYTSAAERMRITGDGNVGIANSGSSTVRFRVLGSHSDSNNYAIEVANSSGASMLTIRNDGLYHLGLRNNSPYNFTTSNSANAYLNSSGGFQRSTSSRRYKTEITDMPYGLSDVMNLRPVTFEGINDTDGRRFGGFIAEEVHDAGLTEFVDYNTEDEPDALAYGNMVALLTKAVQDQQAIIETLQAQVAELQGAN